MAQRGESKCFALETFDGGGAFVAGRARIVENVHFFARQFISDSGIVDLINRAEIAAAQMRPHLVAAFDDVAVAVLQKRRRGVD